MRLFLSPFIQIDGFASPLALRVCEIEEERVIPDGVGRCEGAPAASAEVEQRISLSLSLSPLTLKPPLPPGRRGGGGLRPGRAIAWA